MDKRDLEHKRNDDTDVSWVIGTGRRLMVMKTVDRNTIIKASDIATKTGRSLQNISYAIRELEEHGLIRCITPKKSTWKRFIFTERGIKVLKKLEKIKVLNS